MRTYLIADKKYYKANLHSHSTHSDGKFTPAQCIEAYKKEGYDIYAVTDHCYTDNYHKLFTTEDFVVLNGYENVIWYGDKFIDDDAIRSGLKTYHFNFFAKDPENQIMSGITYDGFYRFFVKVNHPENKVSKYYGDKFAELTYDIESVNKMLAEANEAGFLVQYNHPVWSLNEPNEYLGLKGLWGMEIYNNGCNVVGYHEETPYIYDLMLRDGQKICATATDDNHKAADQFGGFTMIGANSLTYEEVICAMERKDLYASTGPLIDYIYYEDGVFHIKCSPAVKITMTTGNRHARIQTAENSEITTAQFADFDTPDDVQYYRFTVVDKHGNKAFTRGYFKDEIFRSDI